MDKETALTQVLGDLTLLPGWEETEIPSHLLLPAGNPDSPLVCILDIPTLDAAWVERLFSSDETRVLRDILYCRSMLQWDILYLPMYPFQPVDEEGNPRQLTKQETLQMKQYLGAILTIVDPTVLLLSCPRAFQTLVDDKDGRTYPQAATHHSQPRFSVTLPGKFVPATWPAFVAPMLSSVANDRFPGRLDSPTARCFATWTKAIDLADFLRNTPNK